MRICDTCFLASKCPGFEPNATCLYNIPIEVKTKDQMEALQNSLIEIQSQRVLFMKMAEDLGGGYADPNLSSEMDRLQRMIKSKTDSSKDRFNMTVSMTSEAKSNAPSFMGNMFGSSVASKLRELDAPVNADDLIKNSEIGNVIDAEVVE
jgi:hypothetical protein